jgi:hypothetical protein
VPNERTAAHQLAAYATIENEQARDARKIAEALFQPKPTTTTIDHPARQTATTQKEFFRAPRILKVIEPRHVSIIASEQAPHPSLDTSKRQARGISQSEHGRVRTLATYGMTVQEIAELYDLDKSEIERIVTGSRTLEPNTSGEIPRRP